MNGRGFITISMHELERVKIIEAVVQHRLTIVLAAERLQLCERQVSRLVRRYEAAGPAGLVSARRGQPSNRELPVDVRARDGAGARTLRRFWANAGVRETRRVSWRDAGQGNRAALDA
jgi:hypothetical protein